MKMMIGILIGNKYCDCIGLVVSLLLMMGEGMGRERCGGDKKTDGALPSLLFYSFSTHGL